MNCTFCFLFFLNIGNFIVKFENAVIHRGIKERELLVLFFKGFEELKRIFYIFFVRVHFLNFQDYGQLCEMKEILEESF